jgi:hypothetical protein
MPRKPKQLPERKHLTEEQIAAASYVGSPEHKQHAWWGGLPAAYVPEWGQASRLDKQQTTICPLVTAADRAKATEWVRAALRAGNVRFYEADQVFPKKIWYRDESGQLWIGFCVNTAAGEYKGWPADEEECVSIFGRLA